MNKAQQAMNDLLSSPLDFKTKDAKRLISNTLNRLGLRREFDHLKEKYRTEDGKPIEECWKLALDDVAKKIGTELGLQEAQTYRKIGKGKSGQTARHPVGSSPGGNMGRLLGLAQGKKASVTECVKWVLRNMLYGWDEIVEEPPAPEAVSMMKYALLDESGFFNTFVAKMMPSRLEVDKQAFRDDGRGTLDLMEQLGIEMEEQSDEDLQLSGGDDGQGETTVGR